MYTFKINEDEVISLDYQVYFNKSSNELALFIYDLKIEFLQDLQNNKFTSKISLISGGVFYHLILNTGNNKYVFEIYEDKDVIKELFLNKSLEIGFIFKENDILQEHLCFTIDY